MKRALFVLVCLACFSCAYNEYDDFVGVDLSFPELVAGEYAVFSSNVSNNGNESVFLRYVVLHGFFEGAKSVAPSLVLEPGSWVEVNQTVKIPLQYNAFQTYEFFSIAFYESWPCSLENCFKGGKESAGALTGISPSEPRAFPTTKLPAFQSRVLDFKESRQHWFWMPLEKRRPVQSDYVLVKKLSATIMPSVFNAFLGWLPASQEVSLELPVNAVLVSADFAPRGTRVADFRPGELVLSIKTPLFYAGSVRAEVFYGESKEMPVEVEASQPFNRSFEGVSFECVSHAAANPDDVPVFFFTVFHKKHVKQIHCFLDENEVDCEYDGATDNYFAQIPFLAPLSSRTISFCSISGA